jgi:hypothetical protein
VRHMLNWVSRKTTNLRQASDASSSLGPGHSACHPQLEVFSPLSAIFRALARALLKPLSWPAKGPRRMRS